MENYIKYKFTYNKDKDVYVCPQGHELIKYKTRRTKSPVIRYANTNVYMACPVNDLCTPHKYGRTISRKPCDDINDEVDQRTKQNKKLVKKRKSLVEHPFGTIKRSLGFTYFLTQGLESGE